MTCISFSKYKVLLNLYDLGDRNQELVKFYIEKDSFVKFLPNKNQDDAFFHSVYSLWFSCMIENDCLKIYEFNRPIIKENVNAIKQKYSFIRACKVIPMN